MASNAIIERRNNGDSGGAKHTVESLHQYCRDMNAMNFVIANGWEYFVNRRTLPDGRLQHYVDRRDHVMSAPRQMVQQAKTALEAPRDRHPGHVD